MVEAASSSLVTQTIKPFLADEHTRQRSIKLLCSELSCVLNTPADDIKARLRLL